MTVSSASETDARWAKFHGAGLACSCGQTHTGMFDLTFLRPPGVSPDAPLEPVSAVRMDGDFLSQDACVMDGKYFALRMVLLLPIANRPPPAFPLLVWASVERADFEAYVAALKEGRQGSLGRALARLVTRIGGYPDTFGLMGQAFPQPEGPPLLVLSRTQAPGVQGDQLIREHRDGITVDRLFDIYAAHNHDMRPSLS